MKKKEITQHELLAIISKHFFTGESDLEAKSLSLSTSGSVEIFFGKKEAPPVTDGVRGSLFDFIEFAKGRLNSTVERLQWGLIMTRIVEICLNKEFEEYRQSQGAGYRPSPEFSSSRKKLFEGTLSKAIYLGEFLRKMESAHRSGNVPILNLQGSSKSVLMITKLLVDYGVSRHAVFLRDYPV